MKTRNSLFNEAPVLMLLLAVLFLAAGAQGAKHLAYAEWFIDTDPGQGNGTQITLPCDGVWDEATEEFCVSNIPTPNLPDGKHTFFLRMKDSNSQWGMRRMDFFIVPAPIGVPKTITAAEYKIDLAGNWLPLPAADGAYDEAIEYLIAEAVGSGNLALGPHTLYARVKDNYEIWSVERQVPFQVVEASPYKRIVAAEYFIDIDPGHGNGDSLQPDDTAFDSCSESAHLDSISTANLSLGEHLVYVRFKDNWSQYPQKFDGWGTAMPPSTLTVIVPYMCGDADGSRQVDLSDAVFLVNYIFGGGPAPVPIETGDVDCSGKINISDAVYLVNYIFGGGPAPCEGPDCPPEWRG